MIKLIYAASLLLFSSVVLLFSKDRPQSACSQQLSGVVKEEKVDQGIQLVIECDNHQTYTPNIESEGLYLINGSRVRVCYELTKNQTGPHTSIQISDIVYLP